MRQQDIKTPADKGSPRFQNQQLPPKHTFPCEQWAAALHNRPRRSLQLI